MTAWIKKQVVYRLDAERIIPEDEYVFHLEWSPQTHILSVSMIQRGEDSDEDEVSQAERWTRYMRDYTLLQGTVGVSHAKTRLPYRRSHIPDAKDQVANLDGAGGAVRQARSHPGDEREKKEGEEEEWIADAGLEIRFHVSTYHMAFVQGTEELFMRRRRRSTQVKGSTAEEGSAARLIRKRGAQTWRDRIASSLSWEQDGESGAGAESTEGSEEADLGWSKPLGTKGCLEWFNEGEMRVEAHTNKEGQTYRIWRGSACDEANEGMQGVEEESAP